LHNSSHIFVAFVGVLAKTNIKNISYLLGFFEFKTFSFNDLIIAPTMCAILNKVTGYDRIYTIYI